MLILELKIHNCDNYAPHHQADYRFYNFYQCGYCQSYGGNYADDAKYGNDQSFFHAGQKPSIAPKGAFVANRWVVYRILKQAFFSILFINYCNFCITSGCIMEHEIPRLGSTYCADKTKGHCHKYG